MRRILLSFLVAFFGVSASFAEEYKRESWLHGWADADNDCQNTRQEVLARDSRIPVTWDERSCTVESGEWFDPYTGETFTDPSKLDVDHMVPLAEAHLSGGELWSEQQRLAFANDLQLGRASLLAVKASANRSKGSRDPSKWLPERKEFHCAYVTRWTAVKLHWNLSFDEAERLAIADVLLNCGS